MERETQKLTTPAGKELVVKAWLTTRERNAIQLDLIGNDKVDVAQGATMTGAEILKAQENIIRAILVSYDGSTETEKVIEGLLDGRAEEYDFVAAEAQKIFVPLGVKK